MGYWSAVDCDEIHGTRSENTGVNTFNASVVLKCDYGSRYALVNDLIYAPRSWPDFGQAVARTAAIKPIEGAYDTIGQECMYKYALVTVNYTTDADADVITESIEPVSEFRILDHRLFRWGSATGQLVNENEAPGVIVRGFNIVRTFKMDLVPSSILTLPGSTNSAAYTSSLLGLTFAPETLLFGVNPITRVIKNISGPSSFSVSVKFGYKDKTWNKFWNEAANAYQSIYLAGGAIYKPFPPSSFSEYLF
jgi:hypothetical protein